MNKFLLGAVGLVALAASASAADLAPRPYAKAAPMMEAVFSWTGFYIGGNVGGVWEQDRGTTDFFDGTVGPSTHTPQSNALRTSAAIGGVHAGYNQQINRWVLGVEGDLDWTNAKSSFCRQTDILSLACSDNLRGFLTLSEKTSWIASARARVGYTWDRFMIYGTGGVAWGEADTAISANCLLGGCAGSFLPANVTQKFSDTLVGWVAGVGVEAMLTQNWIIRAEYLHTDLGSFTNTLNFAGDVGPQSATWTRGLRYDTVRAGISYKFGGPVVANY